MGARERGALGRTCAGIWLIAVILALLGTAQLVLAIPWPIEPRNQAHSIFKTYGDWNGYGSYIDSTSVPGSYFANIAYHTAVDIPADSGTAVVAVFDGYVTDVRIMPDSLRYLSYITIARTLGGNPSWHCGHMIPDTLRFQVNSPVSLGDTLGHVTVYSPNPNKNHLHFYLEEEVGLLTRSVCNPLDSLVPAPDQDAMILNRSFPSGRHAYLIDYVKDRIETVDSTRTLWDASMQEFLLRDSVDIIAAAVVGVEWDYRPGIHGIGYSVSPIDSGGVIPYRSMLSMRGPFELGDSLEYYATYVDTVRHLPLCRYIITNCGDSLPSPTKGISNVEESCWPTRVDTSGTVEAQRNSEARFPDGWYDVFLKAWSHPGDPDTAAVHDTVYVDNFGGYAKRVTAKQKKPTTRETVVFYDAHWEDGELTIDIQDEVRPSAGDSILISLTFSETMDDTISTKLIGEGDLGLFPVTTIEWDSESFPRDLWTGWLPTTLWDANRNSLSGERTIRIWAEDGVSRKGLDTNPSTPAYWDSQSEQWIGLEDDAGLPSALGGHDTNHSFYIAPYRDVCILVDASSSMNIPGWEFSQVHAPQHLINWMMGEEQSEDYRAAVWRFYNTVEQLADYGNDLNDVWTNLGGAVPQYGNINEPGQFNPGHDLDPWAPLTNVENPLLVATQYAATEYDNPKVICAWSDWWHNLGSEDEGVDASYQFIAEGDLLILFGSEAALYGSECRDELRQAARISGGGYYDGFSPAEVESLYHVIPPIWKSRAFGAHADCEGSDTVTVTVDSTMSRLDVVVSLSGWSQEGIARERESGHERSRGTYELIGPGGSPIPARHTYTGAIMWAIDDPAEWRLAAGSKCHARGGVQRNRPWGQSRLSFGC